MDKYALNGLRGLLSFWVMSHHAWSLSPHATATNKGVIFLYGGAAMPFFFLLSGFSLTLKYGAAKWNTCSVDIGDVHENSHNKKQRRFDHWTFYRNRLIRIFPVYFIGIVLSLILWKFRYMCISVELFKLSVKIVIYLFLYTRIVRYAISTRNSDWNVGIGTIFSVLGINTWTLPYTNFAPNYPGSMISTFFLWYWLFPLLLPRIQRWSNEHINFCIVEAFWVQIGLGLVVVVGLGGLAGNHVSLN